MNERRKNVNINKEAEEYPLIFQSMSVETTAKVIKIAGKYLLAYFDITFTVLNVLQILKLKLTLILVSDSSKTRVFYFTLCIIFT